ncbi:MAG: hypothetical protein MJZ16_08825 [Bacteroidales bacterium]|nr:hypothetical protein [Bacteroidales bacterium]
MAIIVTPQVIVSLLQYHTALLRNPKYKITLQRARVKYLRFWNYVSWQISADIQKGHICMYRDMGQRFNKHNQPKFPDLKILIYKDESQTKWYVAYVEDSETGDITVTKIKDVALVKCEKGSNKKVINEGTLRAIIRETLCRLMCG